MNQQPKKKNEIKYMYTKKGINWTNISKLKRTAQTEKMWDRTSIKSVFSNFWMRFNHKLKDRKKERTYRNYFFFTKTKWIRGFIVVVVEFQTQELS